MGAILEGSSAPSRRKPGGGGGEFLLGEKAGPAF